MVKSRKAAFSATSQFKASDPAGIRTSEGEFIKGAFFYPQCVTKIFDNIKLKGLVLRLIANSYHLTTDQIITELYQSPKIDDCIKKLVPERFRDDFKQELFVILIDGEKRDGQVSTAYHNGKAIFLVVRIIINLLYHERNVYHQKYLIPEKFKPNLIEALITEENTPLRELREASEDDFIKVIEGLKSTDAHYYWLLVEAYRKHGSFREIERQVGIPVATISKQFKRLRKLLNERNTTGGLRSLDLGSQAESSNVA